MEAIFLLHICECCSSGLCTISLLGPCLSELPWKVGESNCSMDIGPWIWNRSPSLNIPLPETAFLRVPPTSVFPYLVLQQCTMNNITDCPLRTCGWAQCPQLSHNCGYLSSIAYASQDIQGVLHYRRGRGDIANSKNNLWDHLNLDVKLIP
jgi:hypothetical protein